MTLDAVEEVQDTRKSGEIIWKDWKETDFRNWHSVTERRDDKTWDDQNVDGRT
jgi:hypothetical protein